MSKGVEKNGLRRKYSAEARCTFGAPLARLFLAGLRPRRARLRFTRPLDYNTAATALPVPPKNPPARALTSGRLWVTPPLPDAVAVLR